MAISRSKAAAVAALSAVAIALGTATSVAAPPPANDDVRAIITGSDIATVTMTSVDANTPTVTVKITNNSDQPLTIGDPNKTAFASPARGSITVTDAALIKRSMTYLTSNLVKPGGGLVPAGALGSLDLKLASGPIGSLGLADPAGAEAAQIQQAYDASRLAAHYAASGAQEWEIAPNEELSVTLPLATPNNGAQRTDFAAGVMVLAKAGTSPTRYYAFSAYESGVNPDELNTGGDSGSGSISTGSISTGSLDGITGSK